MIRPLLVCAVVCLATVAVSAADPKVDKAISVFRQIGSDPAKLKIFCEMSDVVEDLGDGEDPNLEAKIDSYVDQLGPDFEEAWDTIEDTDENSADGKRLDDALDALEDQCPDD
jgi:hypothetical protein